MSYKSALLVTCAVIATAAVVRSGPEAAPANAAAPLVDAATVPTNPVAGISGGAAAIPAQRTGAPDLGALYYFASRHDAARVAAEIKLLRATNPDWQPPADLFTAASGVDEQPLWDLFAKRDFAGVRTGIAQLARDKPDWRPSAAGPRPT